MAHATVAELAAWMGKPGGFSEALGQRAQLLLDAASATIDNEANQPLAFGEQTITLDGTGRRVLIVPRWPIIEVVSLIERDEELIAGDDFRWSAGGFVRRLRGVWPCEERAIVITVQAGHDPIPDDIKGLTLRLASRCWNSPASAQSEQLGDHMIVWRVAGMDLTAGETRIVEKYRAHI